MVAEGAPGDITRQLEEIRRELAGLAANPDPVRVGDDLAAIREHLRRLAADNDDVRRLLGGILKPRVEGPPKEK